MRYSNILQGCLFTLLVVACSDTNAIEEQISQISVDYELYRYDKALYEAKASDLSRLKNDFPYMFPLQYSDSLWISKIQDTLIHNLTGEVVRIFGDFKSERADLDDFFKHMIYYFPNYKVPDVVTAISEVDYKHRVIYADSLLLISLDNFLGKGHRYYEDIYPYIKQSMNPFDLMTDIANAHLQQIVPIPRAHTFLAAIIYEGKKLYLKEKLLPHVAPAVQISYTPKEWQWAKTNEAMVWRYFVDRELLYSTNTNLLNRFVYPAPYSKFYMSIDNDSPPRLGQYMGVQIVKSYMKKNKVSITQLLKIDAQDLFVKANYKPSKR